MPHRCLSCSRVLPEGTDLAAGCSGCGGRAFWHVAEPAKVIIAPSAAEPAPRAARDDEALWSWESRDAWIRKP